jgi:autotransporter-associated beta strand protein
MNAVRHQTVRQIFSLASVGLALALHATTARADSFKADNTTDLDQTGSWANGIVPTGAIAIWDNTVTSVSTTNTIGAGVNFAGIQVANPGPGGNIVINTGSGGTLTLGTSGLDLSAATNSLNINSTISLGGNQTWTSGAFSTNNATQITVTNVVSGSGSLTIAGQAGTPRAIRLNGPNTFTGDFTVNSNAIAFLGGNTLLTPASALVSSPFGLGNIILNGGSTLFLSGGLQIVVTNNPVKKIFLNGDIALGQMPTGGATPIGANRLTLAGSIDLGGVTRTITLARTNATFTNVMASGSAAIQFTTVSNVPAIIENGTLRFATDPDISGVNYASVLFGQQSVWQNNSGFVLASNIVSSFGSGFAFNTVGNYPNANLESGSYLNLSDGGANSRNAQIKSLTGTGTVANFTTGSGTATLTINGGTSTASTEFTGNIRNNDPAFAPTAANGVVAITKSGTSAQTLSGINTYTGTTTVSVGKLVLSNTSTNGAVTVSAGATLGVKAKAAASSWSITTLTMAASTLEVDLGTVGNPSASLISASGAATINGTVIVNLRGSKSAMSVGSFTVVSAASRAGTGSFVLGTVPPGVSASLTDSGTVVTINITAINASSYLQWTGAGGNSWDLGTTVSWQNDTNTALPYSQTPPVSVFFDDTAVSNTAVSVTTTVSPASVELQNNTLAYTFTGGGKISGLATVTKTGNGATTLATANDYSGLTTVASGALVIGNATGLGSTGAGTVVATNAALGLAGSITVTGEALSLTGGGSALGGLTGLRSDSGSNTWAGNITLASEGARFQTVGSTNVLNITGVIDSGGNFYNEAVTVRRGTVIFSAANTYLGGTVIGVDTNRIAGGNNRLPISTVLSLGFGVANAGYLDLNGFNQEVAGLQLYQTNNGSTASAVINLAGTLSTLAVNAGTNASIYGGNLEGNLALTKTGTNSLTLTGANTHTGATTVSGGALIVDGNNGTSAVAVNSSGTLAGTGTVGGSVTVNSGGGLAPANTGTIGTLTASGSLTLAAGSQTRVDINSDTSTSDLVSGPTSVSYGGTLVVNNLGVAAITNGQAFTLFSASSPSGNFSSISPSSPGAGLVWNFNPAAGVLVATNGTSAPAPTNITFTALGGGLIRLDWPAGQGWILQTQTNSRAIGLTTNWVDVTPTPVPPVTNSVGTANGAVFYRLKY